MPIYSNNHFLDTCIAYKCPITENGHTGLNRCLNWSMQKPANIALSMFASCSSRVANN